MMAKPSEIQAMRPLGPVRITIPAAVAYNLETLQKGIANLVERLGCKPCFSGADCTFLLERNFVISEKLEIGPAVSLPQDLIPALSQGPSPNPWGPEPNLWRPVTVTLPSKVSFNLDQVQQLVANIAGRLGCPGCCSGFDIAFRLERELLIDEALNIRPREIF